MSASSPAVRSTGTPQVTWSRAFPATPQQVGEARRFLAAIMEGRSAADAVLCLSELASNAVLHSRSATPGAQFTVRATLKNDLLRVEVSDEGGPWHWPDTGDDQAHGRGLVIVSRLTTAWGRAGTPDTGWTVWYTLTCPPIRLAHQWTAVIDGHRLRELRRGRLLTQVELAGKAGVSLATVVRLERHPQTTCRSRTLTRLATALGEERSRLLATAGERDRIYVLPLCCHERRLIAIRSPRRRRAAISRTITLPAINTTAAAASPPTTKVPLVAAARDALLVYRKRTAFTATLLRGQGRTPEPTSKASSSGLG